MIKVALRGMATRRLRTALTALAIVLGVAMVAAAFTVGDTMRQAADSLSTSAYKGTDAVVSAPSAFKTDWGVGGTETIPASTLASVEAGIVSVAPTPQSVLKADGALTTASVPL